MTTASAGAFSTAMLVALVIEYGWGARRRRGAPTLAMAGLATCFGFVLFGSGDAATSLQPAVPLLLPTLAGLVFFLIVLHSDFRRPRSLRHTQATLAAGLILAAGGMGAPFLALPGLGLYIPGFLESALLTIFWVYLLVGLLEICSLMPALAGLITMAVFALSVIPGASYPSTAGQVLAAALAGAVVGRGLGGMLAGRLRVATKSESLFLGYMVAASTLALFLKSVTIAALVLPLSIGVLILIVLGLQGFERSLLLRKLPRKGS